MRLIEFSRAGLLASVCSTALLIAGGANAQDANENPNDRVTILERIVIGAGNEKVAIDTPQSVSVVEQEDIDQAQAVNIGDVLRDIPGVNVSGSERVLGQAFNIRGIGAPESSGEEGRIIVNVDGATKFYEQYRMGSFFSDPELYKKVEVLRGPASSTLYGSGALGGVINFETKEASDFLRKAIPGSSSPRLPTRQTKTAGFAPVFLPTNWMRKQTSFSRATIEKRTTTQRETEQLSRVRISKPGPGWQSSHIAMKSAGSSNCRISIG